MFDIGVLVRVRTPFSLAFPGEYVIEARSETGAWVICGGVDFAEEHLEVV